MAHVLASELRNSVLQAAMSGKLTHRESNDTEINVKESFFDNEIIPFEIPSHWKYVKLGDMFHIRSATRVHQSDWTTSGVPFYRAREVVKLAKNGCVNNELFISDSLFEKFKYNSGVPSAGDLLVSGVGTLGATYIVKDGDKFYYKDASVLCFENNNGQNPLFAKYLMETPYMVEQIYDQSAFGTTVATLTMKRANEFIVALPPIEEQARIVARVDELMAKIDEYEKLENQLVKLKEQFHQDMKDSLLQAGMTGKLTEQYHSEHSPLRKLKNDTSEYDSDLPSNWSVAKMMTVSELYTGNSISESIKKSKYTGLSSGYNYIGTKDVGFDCSIAYNNGVKIPYDEPKFKIAKKHSTLLCIEGGSAGKKVGITSEDVCFGNKLCSFNAREYINYKFQFYVIQSPTFKKVFIQNKSGMIGGVSIKKLKEILIPLPPIEEQQRIIDKLDELLPLVDKLAELN